ncbi:MAG: efflux RND transporter permease subunit [Candidatus Anammoxibacter sp.]
MYFIDRLIDRPIVVYLSSIFIVLLSLFAFLKLPIEETPKIIIPFIHVQVPYPGASSEEVESQIIRKLEESLESLRDIKNIYSVASEGVAKVTVEFYDGQDPKDVRRDVQDKVDSIRREFPENAEDPMVIEFDFDSMPILLIALSGDVPHVLLKETAKDIKPVLESTPGVSEVVIFGGLEREIHVNVDPVSAVSYGITYAQIANALKTQNMNFPGGHMEIGNSEYLIRTSGKFNSVKEIGETIIYSKDNKLLKLSDIAEIEESYKKVKTISRLNGKKSVTLAVKKQSNINTLKTIRIIKKKMKSLLPTLPPGIEVGFSHDKSTGIIRLVRQLGTNAIYGGLLVIFILFVTMGFRNALLISMAIPFSLLVTLLLLYVFGMSISMISIFSMILILGLVVDGAIIVGENIYQKLEQGLEGAQASKEGILEVAWPVLSSDMTTIAAFLPMLLVTGLSGQFLIVIPLVVTFALVGSVLVDHIIIPTVAVKFMKVRKRKSNTELMNSKFIAQGFKSYFSVTGFQLIVRTCFKNIREYYTWLQHYSLNHRKRVLVYAVVSIIFCVGLIISGSLGFEFFPKVDIGKFSIDFELPPGSSIEETDKMARELEKHLIGITEIVSYVTTIGNTQALKSDIREGGKEGLEYGKISVELVDVDERRRTQTEILEEIKSRIKDVPGVTLSYFELREGPPAGADIAIKISGNNLNTLFSLAESVQSKLRSAQGTYNVRSDFRPGKLEVNIAVNREKASIYGINANDIANAVSKSFLGYVATKIEIDDEDVDIRIQNKKFFKKNIEDIRNVYVTGANGTSIPVGEVSKITLEENISDIRRLNRKRTTTVRAEVSKGFSVDAIKKKVLMEMESEGVPDNYTFVYGGESEGRDKAITELLYSMILAIILIYFILAIQFNSYKQPCVILLAIPLSFVGVVLGLIITGNSFGFMSFVGIIALTGIVVNDAIVLVSYTNNLIKQGKSVGDAVVEAGQRRLRPVLMTTVTTIGGLLPLSLNLGGGGDFWEPMGWSIIFGIGVATFLTLIIIPILYTFIEGEKIRN